MPRRARVIALGLPHHIVQRGHNRQVVFVDDRDFDYYLKTLSNENKSVPLFSCPRNLTLFEWLKCGSKNKIANGVIIV
jgi:hypothetical protein